MPCKDDTPILATVHTLEQIQAAEEWREIQDACGQDVYDPLDERGVGLDVICKEMSREDMDVVRGDVDALVKLYNKRFLDSPIRYIGDDCFERIG